MGGRPGGVTGAIGYFQRACFAAGTPLLLDLSGRSKPIEQIVARRDSVLSCPEDDPFGPLVPKLVEEVFRRFAPLLDLRIGDRVIRTTAEHPFWVGGRVWMLAGSLMEGGRLRSHDGRWVVLGGVAATDRQTARPAAQADLARAATSFYHDGSVFIGRSPRRQGAHAISPQ